MIKILEYTEFPLQHMGKMASICWNTEYPDCEHHKRLGIECLESGHHRVAEFPDITIEISEYSARMVRELYTHVIGVTRLQESTRYVNYADIDKFQFYVPESIKNNENALTCYYNIMDDIRDAYKFLVTQTPALKQDCANILPLGLYTKVVLKINLRALIHMAEVRMCNRALKEYRDFMDELKNTLKVLDSEWDYICTNYMLPKCEILGYCNEKNSCGLMNKKEDALK